MSSFFAIYPLDVFKETHKNPIKCISIRQECSVDDYIGDWLSEASSGPKEANGNSFA